jgi:hypothetical protein
MICSTRGHIGGPSFFVFAKRVCRAADARGASSRMTQNEKDRLLSLLGTEAAWCKGMEARDRRGRPLRHTDSDATAWDIVGAMCVLFGWARACELFLEVARHVAGWRRQPFHRDPESLAMTALLDYNDKSETTYETVVGRLRSIPVRQRKGPVIEPAAGQL